ncbi:MAG: SDR family oxidoreductase [Deltaproteobacteria bacterium]|jgi:NAD(P)-dependent dehydrogenase (short-subunit alcohol dehydrogenase family)|nr:SDR family oxidoreductase [Deltaproteobacteria bacterium]MBW2382873.1 SDR family oxidoreductase [Deltaproteobacteria bacterium]MBW2697896.1 SDR family oxidoreductase [Deltaproteobacteria bacterium]
MGTIAISGCATGIGAATRASLEADGHEVIGIDLKDAEVIADLSTPDGRQAAALAVQGRSDGRLDRVVLCAGVGGHIGNNALVASLNYFGVVDLLDALLPALKQGADPSVVVICSNSAQLSLEFADSSLARAMLDHDEAAARRLADDEFAGQAVYMISKNAVGRAVRRRTLEWGDAGVRLNAVAPGPVETPLLQAGLETPGDGDAIRSFKVPVGRFGRPDEIARVIRFLLAPESGFVHGAVWYVDGGADANVRPDRF